MNLNNIVNNLFPLLHLMKKSFTKNLMTSIYIILGFVLVFGSFAYYHAHAATQPDAFIVEVQPSSFGVNEAVDLTIRAVTANGETVRDYIGDVFIMIDGIADTSDYVVPSEWLYSFLPQDQWVKLFSKWLIIKRQWSFAVKVEDIYETVMGQKSIIVGTNTNSSASEKVDIMSPTAEWIERNQSVNIIAQASTLPNSPYSIFLNNSIIAQGTTDIIGNINTYISGVIAGQNLLQIKISNTQNEIIGESTNLRFTYNPIADNVFTSIQIIPSTKVQQGTRASFNITAGDNVTSAKILLSDGKRLPMDRQTAGLFTKDILMDTDGEIAVSAELIYQGQTKTYTGIATIFVEKSVSIGKIRFYSDSVDKTKLNVTRETIGNADNFKVQYGTSDLLLDQFVIVPDNEIIIENLSIGQKYYFQITPLDTTENTIGIPSEITQTTVGEDLACIVKGITLDNQQIGDKYYLVWTAVQNAESYIIYRSDFETNDSSKMQRITEITGTMFEYPFDKTSKKEIYAYYLVEAVCKDGSNLKIDNAKRLQVWPAENILFLVIFTLFAYCIYRLYVYSKN